ncbi:hypothetical protein D3C74_88780 [compost metagenome]
MSKFSLKTHFHNKIVKWSIKDTKMKRRTPILILAISLLLLFGDRGYNIASAYVDYKTLSIPVHEQEMKNWCWAASAQMVIDYFGGNKSQRQIVNYVKGSVIDKPGSNNETIKALNYGGVEGTHKNGKLTFGSIISQINNNQPILAAVNYYRSKDNVGHMFVIRGYYEDNSDDSYDVYFIDPADGTRNYRNYDSFADNSVYYWDRSIHRIYVN